MIIYEIPQDHLIKLDNWKLREKNFFDTAFKLVEDLTGIKPSEIYENGEFIFKAEKDIDKTKLPDFLKKDHWGYIAPKQGHKKGKEILKKWKEAEIPNISKSELYSYLFDGSLFISIKFDTINGKLHVIQCEGIDLTKYGYIEKEI